MLEVVQCASVVARSFQIVTRHRKEAIAKRQAEQAINDYTQRYGDQIKWYRSNEGALRELFAAEGLVGYAINGAMGVQETTLCLPDGICLAGYDQSQDLKIGYP